MTDTPEREKERESDAPSSRALHNFTLPSQLKWGSQKHLRCVKSHRSSTSATPSLNRKNAKATKIKSSPIATSTMSPATSSGATTHEIEALGEKMASDLKVAANDKLKSIIFEEKEKNKNKGKEKPHKEELPWNLRNRQAIHKTTKDGGNTSVFPGRPSTDKGEGGSSGASTNQGRSKFSLQLSKEEIETDFLLMTGAKPPKKPKKRPKALQKQLDGLFPSSWLTEVTPEKYKIVDVPESKNEK